MWTWEYVLVMGYVETSETDPVRLRGITSDLHDDFNVVETHLNDGWVCQGGVVMLDDSNTADRRLCGQAMIREVML